MRVNQVACVVFPSSPHVLRTPRLRPIRLTAGECFIAMPVLSVIQQRSCLENAFSAITEYQHVPRICNEQRLRTRLKFGSETISPPTLLRVVQS